MRAFGLPFSASSSAMYRRASSASSGLVRPLHREPHFPLVEPVQDLGNRHLLEMLEPNRPHHHRGPARKPRQRKKKRQKSHADTERQLHATNEPHRFNHLRSQFLSHILTSVNKSIRAANERDKHDKTTLLLFRAIRVHSRPSVARNIFPPFCFRPISLYSGVSRRRAIVKFCVLASGSSGNAALLATEKTRILVDAGLSMKELGKRMAAIGEDLEDIDAILVTHEHSDHIAGLPVLARRLKKPEAVLPHAPHRTRHRLGRAPSPSSSRSRPAPVSRSATSRCRASASRTTPSTRSASASRRRASASASPPISATSRSRSSTTCAASDVLLLEANHDLDMLKVGPYPWSVKQRVMSRVGHLSNLVMSDYLMEDLDTCTAHVILGHLSEHNNHPEIVRDAASQALEQRGLDDPPLGRRADATVRSFSILN